MGHSFEQSLHGLPHSFLLFKKVLKILNLPPIAIKAPKGHINLQKNLSINIPKNNNKTTYKTKYHSLLNFIDIAVLKGSTSEAKFNNPGDTKQDKNNIKQEFKEIYYLIINRKPKKSLENILIQLYSSKSFELHKLIQH